MMSRQALMMLPSCCAVDLRASAFSLLPCHVGPLKLRRAIVEVRRPQREAARSAKKIGNFNHIPMPRQRWNFENVRYLELRRPELDILLQQFIQHLPRSVGETVKKSIAVNSAASARSRLLRIGAL
jgi:hypothetical protein